MTAIRVDVEEMEAAAQDVQQAAEEIYEINERVDARLQQLVDGWEGMAEQAFLSELESCRLQAERTARVYAQIAGALRWTAERFREVDFEASDNFHKFITADD